MEGGTDGAGGLVVVLLGKGFSSIVSGLDFSGSVDGPVSFLSGWEWCDWIVNESLRQRWSEKLSRYFVVVQFEWTDGNGLDVGGVDGDGGVADIFEGFI